MRNRPDRRAGQWECTDSGPSPRDGVLRRGVHDGWPGQIAQPALGPLIVGEASLVDVLNAQARRACYRARWLDFSRAYLFFFFGLSVRRLHTVYSSTSRSIPMTPWYSPPT